MNEKNNDKCLDNENKEYRLSDQEFIDIIYKSYHGSTIKGILKRKRNFNETSCKSNVYIQKCYMAISKIK